MRGSGSSAPQSHSGSRPFPGAPGVLRWTLYLASSRGKREHARDCVGEIFRSPSWKHISLHPSLGQNQSQSPTSGPQRMENTVREEKEIGFSGHRLNISATPLHLSHGKMSSHIKRYNFTYFTELWGLKKMFVKHKVNAWHMTCYILLWMFSRNLTQ